MSPGVGSVLWANFENTVLGYDVLGEKGLPAEAVARDVSRGLISQIESKSTTDVFMSDQILVYLALTNKPCSILVPSLTDHAKTNIWLIEQFLDVKFNIQGNKISCGSVV